MINIDVSSIGDVEKPWLSLPHNVLDILKYYQEKLLLDIAYELNWSQERIDNLRTTIHKNGAIIEDDECEIKQYTKSSYDDLFRKLSYKTEGSRETHQNIQHLVEKERAYLKSLNDDEFNKFQNKIQLSNILSRFEIIIALFNNQNYTSAVSQIVPLNRAFDKFEQLKFLTREKREEKLSEELKLLKSHAKKGGETIACLWKQEENKLKEIWLTFPKEVQNSNKKSINLIYKITNTGISFRTIERYLRNWRKDAQG